MWIKKLFPLIVCVFIYNGKAWDVTKVLQNSPNGYNGCFDTYIYGTGSDSSSFTQNFGNEGYLLTAN